MSLVQDIKDGNVISDKYNKDTDTSTKKNSTDDTKQMFLKLLVTEMQYQDPLQPTDNSEYVKEMATFSQVEAVNAIKTDMTTMQANTLVGQCVTVTDDNDKEVTGIVDYVTSDSPPMLSIDGNLYSIENVQAVQEPTYYEATTIAATFTDMVNKLPNVNYLTLSDQSSIEAAANVYDSMTDYQKTFVPESAVATLTSLVTKLNAMKKTAEETAAKEKEAAAAQAAETTTTPTESTTTDSTTTEDTTGTTATAAVEETEGDDTASSDQTSEDEDNTVTDTAEA